MIRIVLLSSIVGAALVATVSVASAQTQLWVSSNGSGTTCSRASPCGDFQTALNYAGELQINCVDSGDYGSATIQQTVVIDCSGVRANVRSIIVNAAQTDTVRLRGLSLNGASSSTASGISFSGGQSLSIEECTISNFSEFGVSFFSGQTTYAPKLNITDSIISNNGTAGQNSGGLTVYYGGNLLVRTTVERTRLTGNASGYLANLAGNGSGTIATVFTDSVIANNTDYGLRHFHQAGVPRQSTTLDRSVVSGNAGFGIRSEGSESYFVLSDTTVIANGIGLSSVSNGGIFSYRNNSLLGNVADGVPTALIPQN